MTYFMTPKDTVTFVVGLTWFMTPKGHGVIRDRSDLLYDPKDHGDLCGQFDLVYDPKRSCFISGSVIGYTLSGRWSSASCSERFCHPVLFYYGFAMYTILYAMNVLFWLTFCACIWLAWVYKNSKPPYFFSGIFNWKHTFVNIGVYLGRRIAYKLERV